ncbi:MAG: hypothetical protein B7733_05795 [Myxococcales bacterium FL481]|nr:MAG: hypothetical protein B7733_05795 [Myxococcales bacterium FL481]
MPPKPHYFGTGQHYHPSFFTELFITCDLTFKKSGPSNNAMLVMGYKRDPRVPVKVNPYGDVYVLDRVCRSMSFTESKAELIRLATEHPAARIKLIERFANGEAMLDDLSGLGGMTAWPPRGKKKSSKHVCWAVAADVHRRGQLYLPNEPWADDMINRFSSLTPGDAGSGDADSADAMAQGIQYIASRRLGTRRALFS